MKPLRRHNLFMLHDPEALLGEPLRLVRPWPDLYLDFYSFTCIIDLAYSLHGCK